MVVDGVVCIDDAEDEGGDMLPVYEPAEMAVVKVFNDAASDLSSSASLSEVEPVNCVGVPEGAGEEATVVLGVYIAEGTTAAAPAERVSIAEEIRPPSVARFSR